MITTVRRHAARVMVREKKTAMNNHCQALLLCLRALHSTGPSFDEGCRKGSASNNSIYLLTHLTQSCIVVETTRENYV